jgi:hypothetical protein
MPSGGQPPGWSCRLASRHQKQKRPDGASCRITSSAAKVDQLPEPALPPHQRCGKAAKRTGHQQSAQPVHDTVLFHPRVGPAFRENLFPSELTSQEKPRPMGIKGRGVSIRIIRRPWDRAVGRRAGRRAESGVQRLATNNCALTDQQGSGNDSRLGSLDSTALGGVERKGLPIGTYAPLRREFCYRRPPASTPALGPFP